MIKVLKSIILIILPIVFLYAENNMLVVTKINLKLDKLPKAFDGIRIAHLSDLHSKEFGKGNKILISKIKTSNPDLIFVTGDLVDASYYNEENIVKFMTEIRDIAPIFYVTGNHELANKNFSILEEKLINKDIEILRNSVMGIKRNGQIIHILGINDPITTNISENHFAYKYLSRELDQVLDQCEPSAFTILLSHRPEQFQLYSERAIDLTFSGHAHGGQIRLPFVGGLIAPDQGLFPKYTAGKYTEKGCTMIVSRGLGNGSLPQRLFNRPEVILVTLNCK